MSGGLFLAVDGGNSKTDVVLGTRDGTVLGFARGPGSSPDNIGLTGTMEVLSSLIAEVRTLAGVTGEVDAVGVYLAGIDLPIELTRLDAAVASAGWARSHVADNDVFALLRAGTADRDAVAVICGAGINCVGRAADGRTARFPALGAISGDWGGGMGLADETLWHAARAADGRGPASLLATAVAAHFGLPTMDDVSAAVHLGTIDRAALLDLVPLLFAAAAAGDAVAATVVERQVEEILALHRVAATRLGLLAAPHAVVLGGGVLRSRQPALHDPLLTRLAVAAPRATVTVLDADPVVGAALLTLDHLGWSAAEPTLRATLTGSIVPAAA
ncbi:N-acetylglucosamine kinase [Spirilliplanes yamanashiensis]|uniref:N-acetylglucosamine kinase n=1 Tax=Spirilliplanes yamanashiensis TaxID=42233 RepID=A0A8J3Y3H4_9ACTN|nr:BadF/BadG/BcrA/BcrD ATPase family protein [Spirilliplanes yamanashiensis]MDP9814243.1 N-acetylglucosamine kinase-like BadF-type ATPase [Spirilliplanes yamanashiensis]GIJ00774.1 N-acetylglucosamine kinase [Spirilliplanes yamanashiensis]